MRAAGDDGRAKTWTVVTKPPSAVVMANIQALVEDRGLTARFARVQLPGPRGVTRSVRGRDRDCCICRGCAHPLIIRRVGA